MSSYSPPCIGRCAFQHRELLSSPTRRSSDLPMGVGERGDLDQLGDPSAPAHVGLDDVGGAHLQQLAEAPPGGFVLIGDRKSTRLNSSHVAISYAVFCVKITNEDSRYSQSYVS